MSALATVLMAALPFAATAGPCTSALQTQTSFIPCYGSVVLTQNVFRAHSGDNPVITFSPSYTGTGEINSTVYTSPGSFSPGLSADVFGTQSASVATNGLFRGESQITSATANLKANTLGVFTSGSPYLSEPVESVQNAPSSIAYLRDQYTVTWSKSMASVLVAISMAIEGTFEESYYKGGGGVQGQFQALSFAGQSLGDAAKQYTTGEPVDDVISLSFVLGGEVDMGDFWETSFDLNALLFTYNLATGTTADFANTASLKLVLPEGVTYRRASDAELIAAVPEPGVIVLLGIGLLGLARIRTTISLGRKNA